MIKTYLANIYRALDCLGSALLGLDPRETISSVLGKLHARIVFRAYPAIYLVNLIFLICRWRVFWC